MAFCTNCGNQFSEGAAFCPNCGTALSGGNPAAPAAPVVAAPPLDYKIEGNNLQIVRIKLKPGQDVYAEAGKMVYKTSSVEWETRMSGKGLGEKLMGALKRKLTGESLFMTHFRTVGAEGEVGLAGDFPGRIQAFDLGPGKSILVQRDGFIAAENSVTLDIAFTKKIGAGLFGGEGFILEKLTGPGTAFIHGGGDFVEFDLAAGEILHVDTGCVVAFDESVQYDVQFAGGDQDRNLRRGRFVPGHAARPRKSHHPNHDAVETSPRTRWRQNRRRRSAWPRRFHQYVPQQRLVLLC